MCHVLLAPKQCVMLVVLGCLSPPFYSDAETNCFLSFFPRMQYTFEAYETEFGKTYETEERAQRKEAFEANLAKIKAHNR